MNQLELLLLSLLNLHTQDIESIHSCLNSENHLSIFLTLARKKKTCPICGSSSLSNGFYSKQLSIPHRAFSHSSVFIKVPRYKCPNHHSFSDSFALAPPHSKVSFDSISLVMELLKDPKMTFSSVAQLASLSESTVVRIFDKHCHLPRLPFPEVICIDEVYTKLNAYDSKYSCIFYDFFNKTILDVLPSRHKSYLHHYFQPLQASHELLNVKFVCIDMYKPYKDIASIYFKKAIICVDSFHVIKHLNDCLQKVRIRILKSYPSDSIQYYLLKQWKSLLFNRKVNLDNQGKYNKRLKQFINFRQLLELILSLHPHLRKAYELKERYIEFNARSSYEDAKKKFDSLYYEFIQANIPEYSEFIMTLSNWKTEIINSFLVYRGKRINSSVAESMNAQISTLLFNTRGIKNIERRRKRIMYAINKTGFLLR